MRGTNMGGIVYKTLCPITYAHDSQQSQALLTGARQDPWA